MDHRRGANFIYRGPRTQVSRCDGQPLLSSVLAVHKDPRPLHSLLGPRILHNLWKVGAQRQEEGERIQTGEFSDGKRHGS